MSEESFENAAPVTFSGTEQPPKPPVEAENLRTYRRRKLGAPDISKIDRLPPHSLEAEQGVLGCMLQDPRTCVPIAVGLLSSGDDCFYDLKHQTIYANMVAMFENRREIDLITLMQRLKDFDMLEQIGGVNYLNSLQDAVPSTANLTYYVDLLREKYLLRKMLAVCTEVANRIHESTDDVDNLIDQIERDVLGVRKMGGTAREVGIRDLVQQGLEEIEEKFRNKGAISGLSTGFIDLDRLTDGLQKGDMIVLAAFPSMGKTSLAMNIAENVVLNLKRPVGVFSLEMTSVSLVKRALCSSARVNARSVIDGFAGDDDFNKISTAAARFSAAKIYFDDATDTSIYQLRAKARRMVQQYGVEFIVVDYLQLLNASGGSRKVESRNQEVADISNGIKAMAKELNIPVLALSQLTETQQGPRLRGSADILADSDNVWMLEPPKTREGEIEETPLVSPVDLWIRKQRNGPRNVCVKLAFMKGWTRFESLQRANTSAPEPEPVRQPTVEEDPSELFNNNPAAPS